MVKFNGKYYTPFICKTCKQPALSTKPHPTYCKRCFQDYRKWFNKNASKIYGYEERAVLNHTTQGLVAPVASATSDPNCENK